MFSESKCQAHMVYSEHDENFYALDRQVIGVGICLCYLNFILVVISQMFVCVTVEQRI